MAQNLMEHALQMERHAEQLATGLAQAGAPKETIQIVTQCASVGRSLAKALGNKNQNPEGANESPEGQEASPEDQAAAQETAEPAQDRSGGAPYGQETADLQAEVQRKRAGR